MKKLIGLLIAAIALVSLSARAEVKVYSKVLTNGASITYSDPLPVSGWLDKIVFTQEGNATTTVTVASYDANGAAMETYCTAAVVGSNKVFRPRYIGTSTAGAALTASALDVPTGTNTVGTILAGLYERTMIGGDVRVALTGTMNDGSNEAKVAIYLQPTDK